MLRKLLVTIAGCGWMLGAGLSARAATLNVGPAQPYTTIQSGINAASSGDTVLVAPGTYYENIDFKGKAITVTSLAGAATTIIDGGGAGPAVTFQSGELRNSIVSGFTVRNGGPVSGSYGEYGGGVYVTKAAPTILNNVITANLNHCIQVEFGAALIQGNELSGTLGTGITSLVGSGVDLEGTYTVGGYSSSVLMGNTIENNLQAHEDGGGVGVSSAQGVVIEGNVIRNNATSGAGGAIASGNTGPITIVDNLIYGNKAQFSSGGISLQPPTDLAGLYAGIIAGNTIVQNTVAGNDAGVTGEQVYLEGNIGDYEMVNNIVVGSSATVPAVTCGQNETYLHFVPLAFDHNDIYNSQGAAYGSMCTNQTASYGNISALPEFVNAAGADFHLMPGSPAIDAGNNSAPQLPAVDLGGTARVQDATGLGFPVVDMGVYEVQGLTSVTPDVLTVVPSNYYFFLINNGPPFLLTADMTSNAGVPTGPVTFFEDLKNVGVVNLDSNGKAVLQPPIPTPGLHAFVATYPGQGPYPAAASVMFYILFPSYSPVIKLVSSPNPSVFGAPVTFTVTITSPDGTVLSPITLADTTAATPPVTLTPDSSGIAMFTTSSLVAGYHNIVASYAGDALYSSASAFVSQDVLNGYTTTMTLKSSPNPSLSGGDVTFEAAVSSSQSGATVPTGSVVFSSGSTMLGSVALDANGLASLATSALPVGADAMTALYQPTGAFLSSMATLTQNVMPAPQTVTFPQPALPAYVATSVALNASASSGGAVTYKVVSGPANVSASGSVWVLTYTGAGTVVVEADQAGGNGYAAGSAQVAVNATLLTEPVGTASGAVTTLVTFAGVGTLGSVTAVTQGALQASGPGSGLGSGQGSGQAAQGDFVVSGSGGGVLGGNGNGSVRSCSVGTSYTAGQVCTLTFIFDPTRPGQRYGGLLLSGANGGTLATSYIYGMGTGPQVGWLPGTQSTLGSGLVKPSGVAVDGNGNIFISEYGGGLAEITAAGAQQNIGSFGITSDVAVDGGGNLIVADQHNVYKVLAVQGSVPANPTVLTVGTGFTLINGVAVDATGNIFVATGTGTATGVATGTGAASDGAVYELQAVNGVIPQTSAPLSLGSGFGRVSGVAVDASGNVYASDADGKAVFELMAVNGVIPAAPVMRSLGGGFTLPSNVRLDAANDVYVTDAAAAAVYEILAVDGSVPSTGATVLTLGTGFSSPQGMVVDGGGNVFFADFGLSGVVKLDYSDVPTLNFAATAIGETSTDSPQTATIVNNGNAPLVFSVPASGASASGNNPSGNNPSISSGFTLAAGSTCPQLTSATSSAPSLPPSGSCTEAVSFQPVVAGVDHGTLVITDNALNGINAVSGGNAMQTVLLNGTGIAATTTALTSSLNPAGVGVSVTFTAVVTSPSGMPTGTVSFTDGTAQNGNPLGSITLVNGSASFSTSALTMGTHTITATYAGTSAFASSSSALTQGIGYQTVTTTAVSPEPSTYGQATVFTVHVQGAAGSTGTPSGSVTLSFCNGATLLIPLDSSGNGSVTQPFAGEIAEPAGSCPYIAKYAGDAYFFASASASTPYIVNTSASVTTLSGTPNPGFAGQTVTLTATVAGNPSPTLGPGGVILPPGATLSTGTVQFFDGAISLGTATLSASQTTPQTASLAISTFGVGTHSITAVYSGDRNLSPSTSTAFVETIELAPTTTMLSASPNPGEQNHAVLLTVNVAALLGAAAPGGSVSIYDGGALLATLNTLSPNGLGSGLGSAASFNALGLTPGTHLLQAFFIPALGFVPSQSTVVSLIIVPQDFTLSANPPSMTVQTEHHATMTLQLASIGGFTANIALSCNGPVPKWVTCYLPAPVALGADGTVPVPFTIDTDAVQFFKSEAQPTVLGKPRGGALAGLLPLAALATLLPLALLGVPKGKTRRRHGLWLGVFVAAASLATLGAAGCSGYYPAHTEPGKYTVTVTAVGTAQGSLSPTTHTLDVTLTVTP